MAVLIDTLEFEASMRRGLRAGKRRGALAVRPRRQRGARRGPWPVVALVKLVADVSDGEEEITSLLECVIDDSVILIVEVEMLGEYLFVRL